MKISFLTFTFFCFTIFCLAQTPQALNYQAVARTAQGQLIPAQNVSVRFSILDGSISGSVVYQETHTTTTNNFGLFTLAIGKGTVVSGTFSAINWAAGDKFLKVEISADGSSNYQLQGTTQLLSVPYALFAEKTKLVAGNAISITNGNTIAGNYVAGLGINISGNSISGNYLAGTGISITGNTISTTNANNFWVADPLGIHYSGVNVGIGTNSDINTGLSILMPAGSSTPLRLRSADTWQTALILGNTSANPLINTVTFSVAGTGNYAIWPGNFGIYNNKLSNWIMNTDNSKNFVAFGNDIEAAQLPRSRVHIFGGDVNIDQIGSGIIMKSSDGRCWRITIDTGGNLVRTSIVCP